MTSVGFLYFEFVLGLVNFSEMLYIKKNNTF